MKMSLIKGMIQDFAEDHWIFREHFASLSYVSPIMTNFTKRKKKTNNNITYYTCTI